MLGSERSKSTSAPRPLTTSTAARKRGARLRVEVVREVLLRHAEAQAREVAVRPAVKSGTSSGAEVESRRSWPAMALSTRAASSHACG